MKLLEDAPQGSPPPVHGSECGVTGKAMFGGCSVQKFDGPPDRRACARLCGEFSMMCPILLKVMNISSIMGSVFGKCPLNGCKIWTSCIPLAPMARRKIHAYASCDICMPAFPCAALHLMILKRLIMESMFSFRSLWKDMSSVIA